MGFLSELTLVQRAGGAAVLVLLLVLLLVKQRQAKGTTTAKSTDAKADAKKGKTSKKRAATPKASKGRSFGLKRKGKGDDAAATPVAETKAAQGRMVPRLPSASDAVEVPQAFEPIDAGDMAGPAVAAPVGDPGDMISEPGWPTPGEVWAAPDAPADAADTAAWQDDAQDDALAALTEVPEADTTEWATDGGVELDAPGWETPAEVAAPAGTSDATWQAEEESFDWTAGDAIDGWATADAPEASEELTSGEAAWEAPEDETPAWTASETTEWQAEDAAPAATAVAEEEFSIGEWAAPAEAVADDEPDVATETPEIVWGPVDEVEEVEVEDEPVAAVVETVVDEPAAEIAPVDEPELTVADAPVDEPAPVAFVEPEVEPELAPVAFVEPEIEPEIEAEPAVTFEPAVAAFDAPVVDEDVPVMDDESEAVEPAFEEHAVAVGAAVANPVARWASMSPGGVTEARGTTSPVDSWARLRPGHTNGVSTANGAVATVVARQAPAAPSVEVSMPAEVAAPSLAWWDVPAAIESDPRRGRFALGGYALQPGHQVVSGVTFRDGVVPPPTHWVIGPVVGEVAPGTLVLHVDGCLNCRPEDLAVLTDPGFAPTTDGFSLRLTASAMGPFAASGTYTIS